MELSCAAMNHAYAQVQQMKTMLLAVDNWLKKAEAHAETVKFPADNFAHFRLAPDAYHLIRQVQAACDSAKLGAYRLAGKEAPSHPDDEKTFPELHARIAKAVASIDALNEKDFEGAESRTVVLPFLKGEKKGMKAYDYLVQFALPNFYFHVNATYQIFRHNGVQLGKMDYMSKLDLIAV
jgi:hypothetical protein